MSDSCQSELREVSARLRSCVSGGKCAYFCVPVGLRRLMTADKAHAAEISLAVWPVGKARIPVIL